MKSWIRLGLVGLSLVVGAGAAEPRVVFQERFAGKLSADWSWLREDPKTWRLKEGALEICVEPGAAHNVKNALVRKAPDRTKNRYACEVTVTFTSPLVNQFEQAGLTWYQGDKPVFKLVHELIDGKTYIIPGKKPTDTKTMQLRLIVDAQQFIAQYRPDGKGEFQTAATGALAPGADEKISVQCYNGPANAEHWMRFADFRIVELPDQAEPSK